MKKQKGRFFYTLILFGLGLYLLWLAVGELPFIEAWFQRLSLIGE